ncbi:MAG TPA: YciI family protein [Jatrophihabitantaceae bacterium]
MTQYLLSVYQPDGTPPPDVDLSQIVADLDVLNEELRASGAWVFTGGLHQASSATVVRVADGETLMTDGPYTEGKEHMGGFTVIEAPDLDAALGWAAKMSRATTLPVEVRPMQKH